MTRNQQLSVFLDLQTEHDFAQQSLCDSSPSVSSNFAIHQMSNQDTSVIPVQV